ncbi:MAG TPA: nucleoside-diphosphate sugar epimerase/dehydratase [Acidimicrobiia bacterium]|jgi:FlaA1/EpsC-like NDP-sugar epimerase
MRVDMLPSGASGDRGSRARRLTLRVARAASQMRGDVPLLLLDIVMALAAYTSVLLLRFDLEVPSKYWQSFEVFLPIACVVQILATLACGGYGRAWRHASIDEARRLLVAGAITIVVLLGVFGWSDNRFPLSIIVSGPVLATFLFGLVRFQSRLFAFRRSTYQGTGVRVAIVGSGNEAASALREMIDNPHLGLLPVVAVDGDASLRWRTIHGVPIDGDVDRLGDVIEAYSVDQVLLAIPDAPRELVRRVADTADVAGVPVRVLRASASWVHGMPRLRDIRELDIEDLLRRTPVDIDLEPIAAMLTGRRVLVTGGGGWIGSEIVRQVAAFAPARLALLDHDETHLHDAMQEIVGRAELVLGDIRDASVVDAIFADVQPEVVFHAAAHKHVPILEDFACEAIRTNVFGSLNVLNACIKSQSEHVVFISTDKAATPTSVMGATKWLAEQILIARAPHEGYEAVRFGNVLGSRGSVIPTFQRQIAEGGPVTVTDRHMTRYFMSTDEAVRLVLLGASTVHDQPILALEMGEQINIYELAERMIRLCGYQPHEDIEIQLAGLRPGENLAEALIGPAERLSAEHDDDQFMSIAPFRLATDELEHALATLEEMVVRGDNEGARTVLLELAAQAARRRPESSATGS